MAVINPVGYLQNVATHTAVVDRLSGGAGLILPDAVGSLRARGGVRSPADMPCTAIGGMVVRCGGGLGYVPSLNALGGTYTVPNDGNIDFTIAASHATLVRKDLIVMQVRDGFYSGAVNQGDILVLTGTAASSPVDPTPAAGIAYVPIARVTVPAGATSIVAGNIERLVDTVHLVGGIRPVTASDVRAGDFTGQYRDHPTLGLQRWSGSAWGDPNVDDTGWINATLASGITTPSGYQALQYRRIRDWVKLRGTSLAAASAGTTLFTTLPVGFRPPARLVFSTNVDNTGYYRYDIHPDGTVVRWQTGGTGNIYVAFTGHEFSII